MKWIKFDADTWRVDSEIFPATLRQSHAFTIAEWILSVPCLNMNLLLGSVDEMSLEEAMARSQERGLERLALIKEVWE